MLIIIYEPLKRLRNKRYFFGKYLYKEMPQKTLE